jgi:FAD/FMN-containing dehydrogenase
MTGLAQRPGGTATAFDASADGLSRPVRELRPDALAAFGRSIAGSVTGPADPGYDAARGIWNLAYQRRPAAIVRPADAADVATASIAWAEDTLASLGRHSIGAYVNFLGAEGDARIREAYPEATYRRLAAVKASWDPENVFWSNQNIRPAG